MIETNMPDDDERVPIEACTLPGTITLSSRALKLAERFQDVVPSGWIMAFSWYEGGRTRANKDSPWVDTGPGLDLGAYRITQVPKEAIYHTGTLKYAILIWQQIVETHPQKTIDVDDAGNVVLR